MFPKQITLNNNSLALGLGLLSLVCLSSGFMLAQSASFTTIPRVDVSILEDQPGSDGEQYKAVQPEFQKVLYPGWQSRAYFGAVLGVLGFISGYSAYQLSPWGDRKIQARLMVCAVDAEDQPPEPVVIRPSRPREVPPTVIERKEELAVSANPFPVEVLEEEPIVHKSICKPVTPVQTLSHMLEIDVQENDDSDYNIAEDLGKYLQTSLIVGVPGAGKGVMFSNAVRYARQYHPNLIIMGIDPKNDPKEDGYWREGFSRKKDGSPLVFRTRLDEMTNDGATEWICRNIEIFKSLPAPKLLVIDEGTIANAMMSKSSKDIKLELYEGSYLTFIKSMASTGDSREEYLWLVSQTAHLSELGFAGDQRSLFRAIALISTKNIANAQALLRTSFIPKTTIEKIMPYIDQSEIKRAIYDGKTNKWYPAIALPNYSGYDRDNRSYLDGIEPEEVDEDAWIENIVMSA